MGGRKKSRDVVAFIDRVRRGDVQLDNTASGAGGFSAALLAKGREAVFLRDRADIVRLRMAAVKSRGCAKQTDKFRCPEVFLDAVASKLAETSELFLTAELVGKFEWLVSLAAFIRHLQCLLSQFPREIDAKFRALSPLQLEQFAREDPKVRRHLDLVRRKDLLDRVLREMEALRALDQAGGGRRRASVEAKEKRWRLFQ